jgi:hypothetical protein
LAYRCLDITGQQDSKSMLPTGEQAVRIRDRCPVKPSAGESNANLGITKGRAYADSRDSVEDQERYEYPQDYPRDGNDGAYENGYVTTTRTRVPAVRGTYSRHSNTHSRG